LLAKLTLKAYLYSHSPNHDFFVERGTAFLMGEGDTFLWAMLHRDVVDTHRGPEETCPLDHERRPRHKEILIMGEEITTIHDDSNSH
jgi:N-formylglutamate amidohydrolase